MITFSYLKSPLFIENLRRIEVLRARLNSIILTREDELRLRWENKVEQIYFDLSLYDLSFTKKNIVETITSIGEPQTEKELLILRWKEALHYAIYNYFFKQQPCTEDELYTLYRIIKPKTPYAPFQELPEYMRYINSEEHPVTRAALLQSIIYNLKPFPELNEPFSHIAFNLSLLWSGWDFRGVVSIEEQYFHDRAYYKELIRNTYDSGNLTQWLEYVSDTFVKQIDKTIKTISTKKTVTEVKNDFFILNDRQKDILQFLDVPGSRITNRELQKRAHISQMTASRDMSKLVELGLIFTQGKGRAVSYSKS